MTTKVKLSIAAIAVAAGAAITVFSPTYTVAEWEQAIVTQFGQPVGETMREWVARIAPQLPQVPARDELAALLDLHYRCRFDPAGVPTDERSQFSTRVDAWLARAQ